jgi:NAD(P)-dependent dehydrogenase (short-subunit alcohol dehydrogenase family)
LNEPTYPIMNALIDHANDALAFKPEQHQFAGKTYLVTGAGQGLGKALAMQLAKLGATVILHGRSVEKLEAVYDEIEQAGGAEPAMLPADFAKVSEADIEQLVIGVRKEAKQLHGLIHCAVDCPSLAPVGNQKLDDLMQNFRVNVAAPIALTRACLPLLTQTANASASRASVIFTAETHAAQPKPFWAGLAVSKGALLTLNSIWPGEFADTTPLNMLTITPGPIASPQRLVTHPGELKRKLPVIESVVPAYLYVLAKGLLPMSENLGLNGQHLQLFKNG